MWIRKLHRMGTSTVLTVPMQLMRVWERMEVRHVLITVDNGGLRVQPLTPEDLMHYPTPEEEALPRGPAR